ncbi:MAG: hypothetical protein M3072_03165 [Candidatus Dormibacteraeota bacterium]|nr:hypothetical protein [Candidatus Dormibacteraeota bacterium]
MIEPRGIHAGLDQAVVQPGAGAVAEVGGEGVMNRRDRVHRNEDRRHLEQRNLDARLPLHRPGQEPDGHRERRGQRAANDDQAPPRKRGAGRNSGQDRQEAPAGAVAKRLQLLNNIPTVHRLSN